MTKTVRADASRCFDRTGALWERTQQGMHGKTERAYVDGGIRAASSSCSVKSSFCLRDSLKEKQVADQLTLSPQGQ